MNNFHIIYWSIDYIISIHLLIYCFFYFNHFFQQTSSSHLWGKKVETPKFQVDNFSRNEKPYVTCKYLTFTKKLIAKWNHKCTFILRNANYASFNGSLV